VVGGKEDEVWSNESDLIVDSEWVPLSVVGVCVCLSEGELSNEEGAEDWYLNR